MSGLEPGYLGRVPYLDPLNVRRHFYFIPPSQHTQFRRARGVSGGKWAHSFILRAVESQAQDPEKRQEDGEGVGAGTRLKSARRPARGEGCGPSCKELSAARRCSRDTSPRRSKRAETCSSLRGGPQRCISPSLSLPGPFFLSAPIHVPYVGKLLPKACHLEAKHRGVVEVEQLPQGEQHRGAVNALFQALNPWG